MPRVAVYYGFVGGVVSLSGVVVAAPVSASTRCDAARVSGRQQVLGVPGR